MGRVSAGNGSECFRISSPESEAESRESKIQSDCEKGPVGSSGSTRTSVKAEIAGNSGEHGPQIQRLVADVDGDDRSRPAKMLGVDLKCFAREEMHGDGIARKCIEHQNVKLLEVAAAGFAFERESRIAKNDLDSAGRITQVSEVGLLAGR